MLRVPGPSGTDRSDPIEMNRLCQRISLGSIPFVRVSRKTRLANLSKRCAYQVVPKETWKLKRSRGGKGQLPLARSAVNDLNGRGGGIRTPDPLLPKQMRYQATLRPDLWIVSQPPSSGVVREPLQKPENQDDRGQKNGRQSDADQYQEDPVSPGLPPRLLQVANDQRVVATVRLPCDVKGVAQERNR